ncbi:MAG: ketoisovalerate oxidoreductase [Gemmatimonadota bacterium]|nr:MAG: ketoisovalerate oxidoreductase [Gemmatimonadota bacterium]
MSTPTRSPQNVFLRRFTRHADGEGLKGTSTHYCAGCGHGLIQKYLAESIAELGLQDRTVMVSPVGCAVFLYYYFDTGNTQAAHGRAPAVALGHKTANPESIVVSYQGDGDLASIGLAEIIHSAQLGLPISVIFVNNAIYGMTGGQMAPTTLPGQPSTTTPDGRGAFHGEPLRVAEMMAGLDGPVYVERTALFNQKSRVRTKKAIKKALRLQADNRGFAFVEVLAECPTHLKLSAQEAEDWVRDHMVPRFPLGVLKDEDRETAFEWAPPVHDVDRTLELLGLPAEDERPPHAEFPEHLHPRDVALKLAGAGGDGAQTAAMLLTKAAIADGFDATHIPSYGPESRGGTSFADVHIARDEVLSPASPEPQVLLAFNPPSLAKFGPLVEPGGWILYDSGVVQDLPELREGVHVVPVPFGEIAKSLGRAVVKNVVALGALCEATRVLSLDSVAAAIDRSLHADCSMMELNQEALRWGAKAVREKISS